MRLAFRGWVIAIALAQVALAVQAQHPAPKSVQLVVPFPAGGVADFVARLVQPEFQKQLGQPVQVENSPGAGGALGLRRVLAAPPDGHTQMLGSPNELILAPLALPALKLKSEDWRMAALIASTPMFLLIRADIPASTVDGLIIWARDRQPSYGSAGVGSLGHLMGERFARLTGLRLNHVPYKGGATLTTDLAGGHLDMAFFPQAGPVPGLVRDGRIRVLGVAQAAPSPVFPDVPPLSRHRLLQGFHFDTWIGVQVPRATPDAAVTRINQAMNEALKSENIRRQVEATGAQVAAALSPADLDRLYAAEIERYRAAALSMNWPPP